MVSPLWEVGPNGVGETDLLETVGHQLTLGSHRSVT
jgi:recombinational DNA repair ATPase RecF